MQKKQTTKQAKQTEAKVTQHVTNPSEKLASLLRKEAMLSARVVKAKTDLQSVQAEIQKMWEERQRQAGELLKDDADEGG